MQDREVDREQKTRECENGQPDPLAPASPWFSYRFSCQRSYPSTCR
jgi:hypothetical protein